MVPSLGTALSNSASSDLAILLILSDEPTARAPNAPVLGGGDGLAARRAEGLDPDEAARRQELADAVVALTMSHRSLLTAASVGPERIACLRAAADIALADARFADAAEAEGRLVEPTFSGQAMTRFEAIRAAQANAATMLDGVLDSLAD